MTATVSVVKTARCVDVGDSEESLDSLGKVASLQNAAVGQKVKGKDSKHQQPG